MNLDPARPETPFPSRGPALGAAASVEMAAGVLITAVIIFCHFLFSFRVGGLCRDEANTIGVATLPTCGDIWRHLEFDSFPILWPLIVRFLCEIGLGSDAALRGVGLVAGLGIIGALWFLAAGFRTGPPLLSLALFAFCPSVIIWGDSVRSHGCGMASSLLTCAYFWRFIERPTRRLWIFAVLSAILAAQFSYYNGVTIFAAGLAGFTVSVRRRNWRTALLALAAGVPAALSYVPYLSIFQRAAEWNPVIQLHGYDLNLFWVKLTESLVSSGAWAIWLWAALLGIAMVLTAASLVSLRDWKPSRAAQDVIAFNAVILGVGIVVYYAFLKRLDYYTQPWYYLTMLAFMAAAFDGIIGASCFNRQTRIARICGCVVIFLALAPGTYSVLPIRLTNLDLIAAKLNSVTGANDFIVVDPWFTGISYSRYRDSSTPWDTVPPLDFHRYQRYDLIKELMQVKDQTEPIRSLMSRAKRTLQANGHVYLVGNLHLFPPNSTLIIPPPAPESAAGWSCEVYLQSWSLQFDAFLQQHAVSAKLLDPLTSTSVNPLEDLPVFVVEGWKD